VKPNSTDTPDLPHLAAGAPAAAGQFVLGRRARLAAAFLPWPRGHLVDFGCGNGAQTLRFAEKFDRITGVDINPDFTVAFDQEIARRGLGDRITTVATDGGPVPLPDGSADCLTSFTVLEHVADERETLAEMRRLLRPGGRLLLTVPNRWWLFETHGADLPLLPWNRVPFVSWWPTRLHDRYARARIYRKRQVRRLLTEAGFTVDSTFNLTAPMDMLTWGPLRSVARATLFRSDRTSFPFLATEIMVAATR